MARIRPFVWVLVLLVVLLPILEALARGRGGGGFRGGGGYRGGGFSRGGPASGGSFRHTRPSTGSRPSTRPPERPSAGGGGFDRRPTGPSTQPVRPGPGTERPGAGNQRPGEGGDRQDNRQDMRQDRQDHRQDSADDRREYRQGQYDEYHDYWHDRDEFYEDRWKYAVGMSLTRRSFESLQCSSTTQVVGGVTYYNCGSTWYQRSYGGGSVTYVVVNAPPGY